MKSKKTVVISIILLLIFAGKALAWSSIFDQESPVRVDKTWTVKFNLPVDVNTVSSNTAYITDTGNNAFPVEYKLRDNDTTLQVIPINKFASGSEYFLHLVNIKSADGKLLKNPVKMFFNTEITPDDIEFRLRKKEIQLRYSEILPQLDRYENIYKLNPSFSLPYNAGILSNSFVDDGLLMTNFIRFLAYLSDDVQINDHWNTLAQHAAVLNMINGVITHYPKKPAGMEQDFYNLGAEGAATSNLSWRLGYYNRDLKDSVFAFMSDRDPENINILGHRRWILNPAMKYVGFGYASRNHEYHSAMKVFDEQNNSIWHYQGDYDYIAWPSSTAFPVSFFEDNDPWSVSLNYKLYDSAKIDEIKVTLKNLNLDKEWVFTKNDINKDTSADKYYNIDTNGYGVPFCVIFRPDNTTYRDGDTYEVTIENIYKTNGEKTTASFVTTFFNLK